MAFVSTNSISQGEQVGVLWSTMFAIYGIKIHFAHRTFKWSNEAKGNAAVHVIIIGFSNFDISRKQLYTYETVNSEPIVSTTANINPYLVAGSDILISSRTKPICQVPELIKGSETTDDGHLMMTEVEVSLIKEKYPEALKFIRPFSGGGDFINGKMRWVLWLKDAAPNEYRHIPMILDKIEKVKAFRSNSNKERTQKWAAFPTLFTEDRQPTSNYLLVPKISSERRLYIPIAFVDPNIIVNNTASFIPNADHYSFGLLQSLMHMSWVRQVCGRMKSDYAYSNKIVYNNFPWPLTPTDKQRQAVEEAAQAVLDARARYPESSLADFYDPNTMPPVLVKAHQQLDRAVDLCYRPQPFTSEAKRIEFLFELYEKYTSGLFVQEKKGSKRKSTAV